MSDDSNQTLNHFFVSNNVLTNINFSKLKKN